MQVKYITIANGRTKAERFLVLPALIERPLVLCLFMGEKKNVIEKIQDQPEDNIL